MISGEVRGAEVVVNGIVGLDKRTVLASYKGVMAALRIGNAASREIISLGDHTLEDLRKLGHPYATRDPRNPHDPPESVHRQRGDYLRALTVTEPHGRSTAIAEGKISIEGDMKQRDRWIQEGTRKMIARPWMRWVMRTQGEAMRAAIIQTILAEMRARK